LSGIWLFNLRSFTTAHLPVSLKHCVIIWMRWNSGRSMTRFEQEWQPTRRTTPVQLVRSCAALIQLYRNYRLFRSRNFLICEPSYVTDCWTRVPVLTISRDLYQGPCRANSRFKSSNP